jgi:hypothetical protein
VSAASVVIIRQNKYIRRFRNAGATTPETARTLDELGVSNTWTFRRMVGRGVFVEVGDGRFYMDSAEMHRFLVGRLIRIAVTAIIALLILLLLNARR